MIYVLLVVAPLIAAALAWAASRTALAVERARVTELYRLLEAKAAPQEFAAYLDAPAQDVPEYLFSEDGLVAVPVSEDE